MIFQAITTKYIGPSNVRGSRVKATASAGSVTLQWNCSLNADKNHARAAEALANKYKWRGAWFGGGMPDGKGNVYVCTDLPRNMDALHSVAAEFITQGEGP